MFDVVIRGGTIVDGTGAAAFAGDVAIDGDTIVAVGSVDGQGRREIDADGAVVTPGFLDLHTHYDGQVTWDDALEPSATNGITTIVLGNCGVGFAPVRPTDHESLVDMMEGVEDIPGSALSVGMPWGEWESFADYLDVIDARRYSANVACHIAHGPVRYFVMGERAYDDHNASEDGCRRDGARRARGLRRRCRRVLDQPLPCPHVAERQGRARHVRSGRGAQRDRARPSAKPVTGCIQGIADGTIFPGDQLDAMPELDLLAELSLLSGRPLTFSTFQAAPQSDVFRRVLDGAAAWNARGRATATADHSPRGHVHDEPRHLPPVHEPADLQGVGRPAGR